MGYLVYFRLQAAFLTCSKSNGIQRLKCKEQIQFGVRFALPCYKLDDPLNPRLRAKKCVSTEKTGSTPHWRPWSSASISRGHFRDIQPRPHTESGYLGVACGITVCDSLSPFKGNEESLPNHDLPQRALMFYMSSLFSLCNTVLFYRWGNLDLGFRCFTLANVPVSKCTARSNPALCVPRLQVCSSVILPPKASI